MFTSSTLAAAAAAAAIIAGLGAGPAQAETAVAHDGRDTTMKADILRVRVAHGDRIRVKATFDNLVKQPRRMSQGATLYLDLDASKPGPELGLSMGLNDGTDYLLGRMRHWRPVGDPVACHYRMKLDWVRDTATVTVGADCLGGAHPTVRVALRSAESVNGKTSRDWLLGRRELTPPITRS